MLLVRLSLKAGKPGFFSGTVGKGGSDNFGLGFLVLAFLGLFDIVFKGS